MNSLDVELLLGGGASGAAVLEIEVELDGKRQTLVQNAVTVYNDLIDTDSYTLQEWGDVIPADSVVRYDTAQSLTSGQQTQARANIGAIAAASLTAYTTKDNELEARIASLESISPTTDDLAAVAGANAPARHHGCHGPGEQPSKQGGCGSRPRHFGHGRPSGCP